MLDVFEKTEMTLLRNPHTSGAAAYPHNLESILHKQMLLDAAAEISRWTGYEPTPLQNLDGLAGEIGVAAIHIKDESHRFGLNSFKALGGAYAVERLLRRQVIANSGQSLSLDDMRRNGYQHITRGITVATATDGNHGRSVAWGAQMFGCNCVIYIHAEVSEARKAAIQQYGAKVVRIAGNYDDSVHQIARDAETNGWFIVSDTSYPGYTELPREVMAGYTVMVQEVLRQLDGAQDITHVLVQGGVGGLAATVCSCLWQHLQGARPRFMVVEPDLAPCLFESATQGKPTSVVIEAETIMAGLSCGEVSELAWKILSVGTDDFVTISDDLVAPAMRLLAASPYGDPPVVAGESAVAGLAALLVLSTDAGLRAETGLDEKSRILLFSTEGATDPLIYERLVRQPPEVVATAGQAG